MAARCGIDQINNKPPQLCRVLKLVLGFIEDEAEQAFFIAQAFEHVAVVIKEDAALLAEWATYTL